MKKSTGWRWRHSAVDRLKFIGEIALIERIAKAEAELIRLKEENAELRVAHKERGQLRSALGQCVEAMKDVEYPLNVSLRRHVKICEWTGLDNTGSDAYKVAQGRIDKLRTALFFRHCSAATYSKSARTRADPTRKIIIYKATRVG